MKEVKEFICNSVLPEKEEIERAVGIVSGNKTIVVKLSWYNMKNAFMFCIIENGNSVNGVVSKIKRMYRRDDFEQKLLDEMIK